MSSETSDSRQWGRAQASMVVRGRIPAQVRKELSAAVRLASPTSEASSPEAH